MDWLKRMNSALNYIEDNLEQEIDLEIAAKKADCSVYHFHRIFTYITDTPVSEYIRRRRMTLAAFELQRSHEKIIDLAMKYGYDSPDAFSRAFQKIHGITPSSARTEGIQLKAYPRISFQLLIKGDVEMTYRIEKAKGFKIIGRSTEISYDNQQYTDIRKFVDHCIQDGTAKQLLQVIGVSEMEALSKENENEISDQPIGGLFAFYGHTTTDFQFMLAVDYHDEENVGDFEVLTIPDATWAVFEMEGKDQSEESLDTVKNIWKRLGEWFQTSDYEHRADVPEIEKRYKTKNGFKAEVWIPITDF